MEKHSIEYYIGNLCSNMATIMIILLIVLLFLSWLKKSVRDYLSNQVGKLKKTLGNDNWLYAIIIALALFILVSNLATRNIILSFTENHQPENIIEHFPLSKVDLFLIIGFVIAIIGVIWAILARIDAEKAFQESRRTRMSFGNSFKFESILTKEDPKNDFIFKLPNIIEYIGANDTTVSLYIGYPIVAWFYKGKMNMKEDVVGVFMDILKKLKEIAAYDKEPTFKLYLGVLSNDDIDNLSQKDIEEKLLDKSLIELYKNTLASLEEKRRDPKWADRIIIIKDIPSYGEKFRFATVHSNKQSIHKALIWVIPDFRPQNHVKFETACFQTQDVTIIEMLHKIFKDSREVEKQSEEEQKKP